MANYTKATNFAAKDGLPPGNTGKIVKGTEIDTEFTAIASAITSKADTNSPTFTGTPAAPTATAGSNTTQIATTAYVKGEVDELTGRILQTVSTKFTNSSQTTSTSYSDTFATVTITPSSTSSKIILISSGMLAFFNYSGYAAIRMVRNSGSNVIVGDQLLWASNGFNQAPYQTYSGMTLHCIDSPNTTSAVTYKIQLKSYSSGATGTAVYGMNDVDGTVFTAMEIL